jgi:CBS domain-containing protein
MWLGRLAVLIAVLPALTSQRWMYRGAVVLHHPNGRAEDGSPLRHPTGTMKASDIMKRGVRTIGLGDDLSAAAQIMWDNDCGCVPVVDSDGRGIGMITDRDICMAALTKGEPLHRIRVGDVASRKLLAIREDDPVDYAEGIMHRGQIRRVPVLDDEGRPVGMVSMADLVRNVHASGRPDDGLTPENIVMTLAAVTRAKQRSSLV